MNTILRTETFQSMINKFIDFKPQINKKQAFVKITDIELPDINNGKIVAYVGSRKAFKNQIVSHENPHTKIWNFLYTNKNHSSFVLALYNQQSKLSEDKLLGEIEIRLSSFKSNSVTKHTFILRSSDRNSVPIRVTLSIHLSENGSKALEAPESNILNYEYEIFSNKKRQDSSFDNVMI